MQWWCAATGVPWTWEWRAYPGVWLFMLALIAVLPLVRRRLDAADPEDRGRPVVYGLGIVALWLALDWPIGALGGGYLASAHMVQFLLIAYIAAPLLLVGLPRVLLARAQTHPRWGRAVRAITHPLPAVVGFNVIITVTHIPWLSDALMVSQLGSFAIDAAWLLAGCLFWWPVVAPAPHRPWLTAPLRVGYLGVHLILGTPLFAYLAFADLPLYAVYELAPRVNGIDARADQQAAGMLMKVVGMPILLVATALVFLPWAKREERTDVAVHPAPVPEAR